MSYFSKILTTSILVLVVGVHTIAKTPPLADGQLFGVISDGFYTMFRERVAKKLAGYGLDDSYIDEGTRDLADGFALCFLRAAELSSDPLAKKLFEDDCESDSADCVQEKIDPARLGLNCLTRCPRTWSPVLMKP